MVENTGSGASPGNAQDSARGKCRIWGALPAFLVVLFIWGHSMMPHNLSFRESGFIFWIFTSLFGPGAVSEFLIRRSAHVLEYLALGIALSVTFLRKRTFRRVLWVLNLGCLVAFMDETIQIFSGRTARIADAWLDLSGVLAGVLIMAAVTCARGQDRG